ncbi:methyltransferase N6AMT1-like [Anneissia japonica]|uniref:methyltransferase N6AMT1-like n=1 Tax=Anneissia japonica TaxID=1529436 RepID=UPI001425BB35|nr:methyltransferase N6AMT1-like [Anneissia japonica]XP_033100796.1 methyltransferase N6AMT1-like [Anneissia japonica]XP_033100797.1 methyltransferase N6AMT1-like [Anneissia japonica]XP_033100798.1 methyltransferase N6AMT1-like [Anneissia japonica]XP_033100799.1 methyltransferase N6AMT1-like [Anneissia japonica]
MFKTPDISHLKAEDYDHVYEPAEDTFLLLDALEKDNAFIQKTRPTLCVEVGCGSGTVTTFLSKLLGNSAQCIGTDLNGFATSTTKRTAIQNSASVEIVQMDLVNSFLPRLCGQVDLILFNPPYVVTPSEEVGVGGITASWAGGIHGMEVTNRFLPIVPKLLSQEGAFYLVAIKENKIGNIEEQMLSCGLIMEKILERKAGSERLAILKFTRIT